MTRIIATGLALVLISALTEGDQARPSEDTVPELVVSIQPSFGVVPLDAADRVAPYTFSVHAVDRENKRRYAGVQVFVRLGQSRLIDRGNEESRIRGAIELREDGRAKYRLELTAHGKTLARTSATVKVVPASD